MSDSSLVNKKPVVYYMRDNHTFKRLTGSVQEMIDQCVIEITMNGYCHGSVFCKVENTMTFSVHSHGVKNLADFVKELNVKLNELIF